MERSLAGLMELIIRLAVGVAIVKRIRVAIAQAHITGLNVATRARQHRVDCRKRLRQRYALGQLCLHERPESSPHQ